MSDKTAVETAKKEIYRVIDSSIGWAADKDKVRLFNSVAQDADFFIFHPDSKSTIVGFEAFRNMTERVFMDENFRATWYDIRDMKITLSQTGTTAWFAALLDDFGEYNGRTYAWVNTRWTGVLEKRNGRWVIVQMHFSFASDAIETKK